MAPPRLLALSVPLFPLAARLRALGDAARARAAAAGDGDQLAFATELGGVPGGFHRAALERRNLEHPKGPVPHQRLRIAHGALEAGDGFGAGFEDEGAGVQGVVNTVGHGLEEAAVADGGEFEGRDVGGGGAGAEGIGGQTRELKSEIRKEEEKERGVPEHGSQTDAGCAGLRA